MRSEVYENRHVEWSLNLPDKIKTVQQLVSKNCHIRFNESRPVSYVRMDELSELDVRCTWLRSNVKCAAQDTAWFLCGGTGPALSMSTAPRVVRSVEELRHVY